MGKELPKNWITVSLKDITKNVKGKKPKIQSEVEFEGSVPYMDIKALEYNEIRQYADIESSKLFEEGDVAMVWDGARSGWVSKTNFGAIGSTLVAFKPIDINSDYLFYYLLEKYPYINSNARGVGIPHVDPTVLWGLDFPLPPLAEQNRIVAKLDTLFAQLEIIKASMGNILLLLKDFRQQVLDKEFNQNFKKIELQNLCFKIQDGAHHSPKITYESQLENTFPYITSKNIRNNYMKLDNVRYVDFEFHNSIYPRCTPEIGDVLLTKDGANTGNVTLNELNEPFSLLSSVCLIKTYKEKLLPEYLTYYFQSNIGFSELIGEMTGTAIKRIVLKKIKATQIPVPSLEKQREIVNRAESLFAKANAIEKQYKTLKQKIDTLPQALLHKAFKGELTEQLDSDGDARELLDEIKVLKSEIKKKSK